MSFRFSAAVLALCAIAGTGFADTLLIENVRTGAHNTPQRGMSMQAVEATFGAPAGRRPAVGDPPITRWEYDSFVVFFEHRHVIHAVTKRPPSS